MQGWPFPVDMSRSKRNLLIRIFKKIDLDLVLHLEKPKNLKTF